MPASLTLQELRSSQPALGTERVSGECVLGSQTERTSQAFWRWHCSWALKPGRVEEEKGIGGCSEEGGDHRERWLSALSPGPHKIDAPYQTSHRKKLRLREASAMAPNLAASEPAFQGLNSCRGTRESHADLEWQGLAMARGCKIGLSSVN
jgi:hypothetical protein